MCSQRETFRNRKNQKERSFKNEEKTQRTEGINERTWKNEWWQETESDAWWKRAGHHWRGGKCHGLMKCCFTKKHYRGSFIFLVILSPLLRALPSLCIHSIRGLWVMLWSLGRPYVFPLSPAGRLAPNFPICSMDISPLAVYIDLWRLKACKTLAWIRVAWQLLRSRPRTPPCSSFTWDVGEWGWGWRWWGGGGAGSGLDR